MFEKWSIRMGLQNTPTAYLQRAKTPHNVCLGYDNKQSDGEAPVILDLWRMRSTPLLPSLPEPLKAEVVAPKTVISMGQIKLNSVLMLNLCVWNRTVFHI